MYAISLLGPLHARPFALLFIVFNLLVGLGACTDPARPSVKEEANLKAVTIPVEGMSCVACAARVKQSLTSLAGVGDVEVSLAERNARVRFDPSRLAADKLVAAINGLGYRAGTPTEAK